MTSVHDPVTVIEDTDALPAEEYQPPEAPGGPGPDAVPDMQRGPFLYHGGRAAARTRHAALAAALGVEPVERRASSVLLGPDPVLETMAMLRDAVFLRVRVLKKVLEGRVMRLDPGRATTALAPPVVELVLRTDSDERPLRLDGAFAAALWETGADVGDIVQIDKTTPIASLRRDRDVAEGWVHEERDFVYRLRLGDMDRARTQRTPLLGTGRTPAAGLEAMRATDTEAQERLTTKGTRLEPGLLLVTDVELLPEPALALLQAAVGAPGAPLVVLQSERDATLHDLRRRFESALVLDP